eukprot:7280694-Pyramimonas_sp.AAC.1
MEWLNKGLMPASSSGVQTSERVRHRATALTQTVWVGAQASGARPRLLLRPPPPARKGRARPVVYEGVRGVPRGGGQLLPHRSPQGGGPATDAEPLGPRVFSNPTLSDPCRLGNSLLPTGLSVFRFPGGLAGTRPT